MKFLIIIPAHNEENNISFCLESLKKQNFQDFVCMIVNDGSTDRTAEIINNFKIQDSRFSIQNIESVKGNYGI